jgi:hypothetical protein
MGGSTKRYDTTPAQTSKLRGGIVDYLMGPGGGSGGPSAQYPNKATPYQSSVLNGSGASGFGTQGNGTGSPFDRINSGTVAPPQSIDQLGGASSPFFQNMMSRYQPAFDQARTMGLASAKEASGTLTGSGYGNILGAAVNRSIADQGATMAGIAGHGLDLEAARQANVFNQANDTSRQNAMNFLQLLMGQGLAGVGPDTIMHSGGIGALIGPFMQLAGKYLGRNTSDPSSTGSTDSGGGNYGPNPDQGYGL